MADRVAVAKFIEAGIATGRSPMTCLELLNDDELKIVIDDFLNRAGTQWTLEINLAERSWALENNKIECIKTVRRVAGLALKDAKEFVCGERAITVNDTVKNELIRLFGDAIAVN